MHERREEDDRSPVNRISVQSAWHPLHVHLVNERVDVDMSVHERHGVRGRPGIGRAGDRP